MKEDVIYVMSSLIGWDLVQPLLQNRTWHFGFPFSCLNVQWMWILCMCRGHFNIKTIFSVIVIPRIMFIKLCDTNSCCNGWATFLKISTGSVTFSYWLIYEALFQMPFSLCIDVSCNNLLGLFSHYLAVKINIIIKSLLVSSWSYIRQWVSSVLRNMFQT